MKQRYYKHLLSVAVAVSLIVLGCTTYDDGPLWDKVNEIDSRLDSLELVVSHLNSDIIYFRPLFEALEKNVYVTDMTETSDGYVLTFSDGRKITLKDGLNGQTPHIGSNGNWWIGNEDTGVKAQGEDGRTPYIGNNDNWWIGTTDTGVRAKGTDGETPRIGSNGNWWIGSFDTGVKAKGENGKNGHTPYVGDNGNWWIDGADTGYQAIGRDGLTPHIGDNGNWWIGLTDTGVKAAGQDGQDGETPRIGDNGNWWIGDIDTGIQVITGDVNISSVPIIGVDLYEGIYYWTVTVNGETTWLLSKDNKMLPVSGYAPIFQTSYQGYLIYSVDNGVTWLYIYDVNGNPVLASSGGKCSCTQFFQNVYVSGDYLILILIDGTEIKIRIGGGNNRGDIPEDPTTPTPSLPGEPNTPIPYPHFTPEVDEWGNHIVTMNFTGIQDPNTGDWISLFGTNKDNQNVWVEVDGSPKGIVVINLEDNSTRVKNDIVFTVDNSGSMSEEANAIANGIANWAQLLDSKGLDVRFGIVGFGGNVGSEYNYLVNNYGVTGAIDFTSSNDLTAYLNRSSGVYRTQGYAGSNAGSLQSEAAKDKWSQAGGENGAQAIRFANEIFSFRATANRIYVNFTDDCNFTGCNDEISVKYFNNHTNWPTSNGTVHSVISNDKDFLISRASRYDSWEYPWLISEYTNGTTMFVRADASDLHLETLTVSDAITHSYTIRFIIPDRLLDGQPHVVRIVVIANNGTVRGVLEVTAIFGTL